MAGEVRKLIDELLALRAGNSSALQHFVKVNLLLNGIDPEAYSGTSEDDPVKIAQLEKMIREFKQR